MERARVFKTAGKIRIFGNLTLFELLAVVAVFAFTMETFKLPAIPKFILSAGVTYGVWWLYDSIKHLFPGAAVRHLATWLSQADRYYPSKDPVSRPLVYRPTAGRPLVIVRPAPSQPNERHES